MYTFLPPNLFLKSEKKVFIKIDVRPKNQFTTPPLINQ